MSQTTCPIGQSRFFHARVHGPYTPGAVERRAGECPVSHVTRASFIVRVVRDRRGRVSGVIERVATGAKEAFMGPEVMGPVIVRMLRRDEPLPPARSWSASP